MTDHEDKKLEKEITAIEDAIEKLEEDTLSADLGDAVTSSANLRVDIDEAEKEVEAEITREVGEVTKDIEELEKLTKKLDTKE